MHEQRIVHRDIKPMNIFMKENYEVRIGDFGITKRIPPNKTHLTEMIGTPSYLSPEFISKKRYNEKTDVWGLGCILYEMCKQKKPYFSKNEKELQRMITSGIVNKKDQKTSPQNILWI